MQALVGDQANFPALECVDEPDIISPDEVKIRPLYSTLCRDDMSASDTFNLFRYGVIGHEASGVIVEAGKSARKHGFIEGMRVALIPFDSCGHCRNCLAQKPQYCLEARLIYGVLAEYVVRRYSQLIPLPKDLSYRQACLLEPVGDALTALSKVHTDFSSEVLLVGGGFFGQVLLRILRMIGVKTIVVIEPLPDRRALALHTQADAVFTPNAPNLQFELLKLTEFRGFDLVIDTSARSDIFDFALPCLKRNAAFLMAAYKDVQEKLSLPVLNMYAANARVVWSCFCGRESMESAAHIITRLELDNLITAEYPFSKSAEAYQKYTGTEELKIGIRFDARTG